MGDPNNYTPDKNRFIEVYNIFLGEFNKNRTRFNADRSNRLAMVVDILEYIRGAEDQNPTEKFLKGL